MKHNAVPNIDMLEGTKSNNGGTSQHVEMNTILTSFFILIFYISNQLHETFPRFTNYWLYSHLKVHFKSFHE